MNLTEMSMNFFSRRSVVVGSLAAALDPLTSALAAGTAAVPGLPIGFRPDLPASIRSRLVPILAVGLSGSTFPAFLRRAGMSLPPAPDVVSIQDRLFTVKIGNSRAYQMQDGPAGRPVSEFKSRAEIDTMKIGPTRYGAGDYRVCRMLFKLDRAFYYDKNIAILNQFKHVSAGFDLAVGVKHGDVVLRVGTQNTSFASQTTIVKSVRMDKWIELVLAVHWSDTSNGRIDLFYRYADEAAFNFVATVPGQNLERAGGMDYVKFGIYKPNNFPGEAPLSATQIVTFAEYAIFKDPALP